VKYPMDAKHGGKRGFVAAQKKKEKMIREKSGAPAGDENQLA